MLALLEGLLPVDAKRLRKTFHAAPGTDWQGMNDGFTGEGLRKILKREPTLLKVTDAQKAICTTES